MTYTVITSNNPITTDTPLPTGVPELLPGVSVGDSFSVNLFGRNSAAPSQTETSGSYARTTSGVTFGGPSGLTRVPPTRPPVTLQNTSIVIFKQITNVEWVKTLGPNGNAVAQNELGDWFTESALSTPDSFGSGLRLERIVPASGTTVTESVVAVDGGTVSGVTYAAPPYLKLSGSYNSAIFPYNDFQYTNNNLKGEANVLHAKSLYELPERIDSLIAFLPDSRSNTTLRFTVRVSYTLNVTWGGIGAFLSTTERNKILALYSSRGYTTSGTGTELHEVSHAVTNNINTWGDVLDDILENRVRTLAEQDALYQTPYSNKSASFS